MNEKRNLQELIALYHGDMLSKNEHDFMSDYFDTHPEARLEADSYAAAIRIMQKGSHQIPKLNSDEWDQLIGGLMNKVETESILHDAHLDDFRPDPVPLKFRVFRVAAAVLFICSVSFGSYQLSQRPLPATQLSPQQKQILKRQKQVQEKLKRILPSDTSSAARTSLKSIFNDDFLLRENIQTQTKTIKINMFKNSDTIDMDALKNTLIFEAPNSATPVYWILEDSILSENK